MDERESLSRLLRPFFPGKMAVLSGMCVFM